MRNIYASVGKGNIFLKSPFYRGISRRNIFTAQDPSYHATVRKLFSPSLSPGSVQAHEGVIRDCVSRLHDVLRDRIAQTDTLSLNDLYYCHAVDTVSEVLLGKSLGCLKRGRPYFWTEQLPRIFYWATIRDQFQGSGVPSVIKWLLRRFLRKGIRGRAEEARMRLINEYFTTVLFFFPWHMLTQNRQLRAPHARRDMMVEVMERAPQSDLPEAEIAENFSAVMLAGFHTTQNALCAAIYFVLTHSAAHVKLKNELDSAYSSTADINDQVQKLPYLNAVITEALRLYPPVPVGGPRVSPGGYVDGTYIPAGVSYLSLNFGPDHSS